MGLFDKIFKSEQDIAREEIDKVPWKYLTSMEDLKGLEKSALERVVVIFKYSTRCGISRMSLRQFENEYNFNKKKVEPWFLDLIKYREISDEIARKYSVTHESPQLIILKGGEVVHHASHQGVSAESIRKFVE